MNEQQLTDYVFWDKSARGKYGNLIYSHSETDANFDGTMFEILISNNEKEINIMYSKSEIKDMEQQPKEYFVKMCFTRDVNNELSLETDKTSPKIKSIDDVRVVMEGLRNTIIGFNSRPNFFVTGTKKTEPVKTIKIN